MAFKPAGQKGQGPLFFLPGWVYVTLLNIAHCVKVGSLYCCSILSKFFAKPLKIMTSSFGKLLGTFPPKRLVEIKYKKSTGSQDRWNIYLFPQIPAELAIALICFPLFIQSHSQYFMLPRV